MNATRLASVCALFVCVLVSFPSTARPVVAPPFQRLPNGARQLCSQHVTGTTMHITWTSYAVREPVAQTRAFYEGMGLRFTAGTDGSATHAPNDQDRLMIYPANGSYPSCDQRPLPAEQSVIVRSRATR